MGLQEDGIRAVGQWLQTCGGLAANRIVAEPYNGTRIAQTYASIQVISPFASKQSTAEADFDYDADDEDAPFGVTFKHFQTATFRVQVYGTSSADILERAISLVEHPTYQAHLDSVGFSLDVPRGVIRLDRALEDGSEERAYVDVDLSCTHLSERVMISATDTVTVNASLVEGTPSTSAPIDLIVTESL